MTAFKVLVLFTDGTWFDVLLSNAVTFRHVWMWLTSRFVIEELFVGWEPVAVCSSFLRSLYM